MIKCNIRTSALILIILNAALLLAGCSMGKSAGTLTEKDIPRGFNSSGAEDVKRRIDELNYGLAPKVRPTGQADAGSRTNAGTGAQNPGQGSYEDGSEMEVKLENLASKYAKAVLKTNFGDIEIMFYKDDCPLTVNNFLNLAKKGFYDGTQFHRVEKDFIIQGGDPNSKDADPNNDGTGGPGYKFRDEINSRPLVKGSLAMANSGPDTNGSQFFIVTASSTPQLDGKHAHFGYVASGLEVVERINNTLTDDTSHPLEPVILSSIDLLE